MLATDDPARLAEAARMAEAARIMRTALDRLRLRLAGLVDEAAQEAGQTLDDDERADRVEALFQAHLRFAGRTHRLSDEEFARVEEAVLGRARAHLRDGDVHAALEELRHYVYAPDPLATVARKLTAERFGK